MSLEPEIRERVVRLEVQGNHQTEKLDALKDQIEALNRKVSDLHEIFLQAKGARWAILGMAAIGGFIATKLGSLIPWVGK